MKRASVRASKTGDRGIPRESRRRGFVLLAVLVFVGFTARRASQLESEVAQLSERLSQATGERPR